MLTECFCQTLLEGGKFEDMVDNRNIDVRDVAEAHVLAAELPHAKVCFESSTNPSVSSRLFQMKEWYLQRILKKPVS